MCFKSTSSSSPRNQDPVSHLWQRCYHFTTAPSLKQGSHLTNNFNVKASSPGAGLQSTVMLASLSTMALPSHPDLPADSHLLLGSMLYLHLHGANPNPNLHLKPKRLTLFLSALSSLPCPACQLTAPRPVSLLDHKRF